jgi:hypothetical protein
MFDNMFGRPTIPMVDPGWPGQKNFGIFQLGAFGFGFRHKKGALSQRGLQDKKHFSEQAWLGSCCLVITDYR